MRFKIKEREINSYYSHNRKDVLMLVPEEARRVLDVGCGAGSLGKELKKSGAEVFGIEISPDACEAAGKKIDKVFLCDAEEFSPPFSDKYFDCIIFADILEHLRDPQATLEKYRRYLNDDGRVISSIPNVRYYKLIIRLLRGSWDYSDSGLLDKSHLRFFTLINIKEMFEEAGYKIIGLERNIVAARGFKILNFLLSNWLKEFLTYQYYIVAKKKQTDPKDSRKRKVYKF